MKKDFLSNIIHSIITGASLVLIILVVLFSNKVGQIDLKSGDVSTEDIYAPRTIIDTVTTNARREAAKKEVEDAYTANESKRLVALDSISDFLALATTLRGDEEKSVAASVAELQSNAKLEITSNVAHTILTANEAQFEQFRQIENIVGDIMTHGIADIDEARKECEKKVSKLKLTDSQKTVANKIASLVMVVNYEVDEPETQRRREAAANAVSEIEFKKNQVIVRKGEIVTDAQLEMLRQLGLVKGSNPLSPSYTTGVVLLMIICYIIILIFYSKQKKKIPYAMPIASLMALLIILMVFYGSKYIPADMIPLLPAGLFPGIVTIFSTPQISIITNLALSIFCAIAFDSSWGYAICLIVAGTITSYCFAAVKRRSHLLPASIISSFFYGLVFCAMSLIEASGAFTAFIAYGKGFGGGFLSGLITIGSLPLIEWIFNATTPMKLSELANPENKLLKRLLVEAPGTYHHSLTVANISEIAARNVNADALLARVGAYYHDIGKLCSPLHFKENQFDSNIHDTLSPEESSKIIISHVNEGVEFAQKNRLPQSVIDIIAQHHGTTTTGYFLVRARELGEVEEALFTYPGPVPQTKEAAIVMLADSCEAAVRSIEDKTEEKIEGMVRRLATERVNSGQFSKCNMTFEELEIVIKVITKTLGGYFHDRIKYE